MNQITDPDEITNKDARKSFSKIAPIVLIINLIAAAVIWFMSDSLFNQEKDFLGGLLAGGLVLSGLFSYIILKLMSKKVTRIDRPSKDK